MDNNTLHSRLCAIGFLILGWLHLIAGLKMTGTVIPHYAVLSRAALLECHFELDNDTLYALKWYKDNHEFFRFKPSDSPPITVFPVLGVSVNRNQSSLNYVQLEPISLSSKGVYRCEISADAPSFQTLYDDQYMKVMAMPEKGPSITGVNPWYNIGDTLNAKCHVHRSFPSPTLSWLINDIQVDAEDCECITAEVFEVGKTGEGTNYYSQTSHLKFQVDPQFFRDGSVIVECKASFPKTQIVLKDTVQSNIKAGFGLRQYAADTLSAAVKRSQFKEGNILISSLIFSYFYRGWGL